MPALPETEPVWPVLTRYDADHLARIALPLGGIGTGTVSLGGRGDLRDWEIANRPAKGFTPSSCFFALRVGDEQGQTLAVRCLEGPLDESAYEGGFGSPARNHGLPRFRHAAFAAAYPFGQVTLSDPALPVSVRLEAFNPLIPGDAVRSGVPVAILRYVLTNQSGVPLTAAVCGSVKNFLGSDGTTEAAKANRNRFQRDDGLAGIVFEAGGVAPDAETFGGMALAVLTAEEPQKEENRQETRDKRPGTEQTTGDTGNTGEAKGKPQRHEEHEEERKEDGRREAGEDAQEADGVSWRTAWARRTWGDSLLDFWDDFSDDGRLEERDAEGEDQPIGSLARTVALAPGETRAVTFLLTWRFPNRLSWTPNKHGANRAVVGNAYAERYTDAWDAARYAAANLPALEADTLLFVQAFCDSDLPQAVKEAALYNVSTLRTQTVFQTPDGRLFGWEGCGDKAGCCEGNCTHVWNYETTTAFLFGDLARTMREVELAYATIDTGFMAFRAQLPLDVAAQSGVAAADGQMGCLMKLYREWRLSGDDEWLKSLWPRAKQALAFAWIEHGWDGDRDGVMEGCQHNTMDVEYYGPNPQMGAWYLGALRASEEMALYLGEADFADECRRLFESGSAWLDANLFNGDYYEHQVVPPQSEAAIAPGLRLNMGAQNLADPELQLGAGCLVDQLVGQYMAHVCGLGYLLKPENVRKTLASILRWNFQSDLWGHFNHLRTFALQGEAALLMATYPKGRRPARPFPYYNEVMTGFEHTAAAHMLYEGLTDGGLRVVEAIRHRYDGRRRSPFDEAECGHHYARAMAAWTHVLALTGFGWDGVTETMTFAPPPDSLPDGESVRHFWSNGTAWGTCEVKRGDSGVSVRLTLLSGRLRIKRLVVGDRSAEVAPAARVLERQRALTVRLAGV